MVTPTGGSTLASTEPPAPNQPKARRVPADPVFALRTHSGLDFYRLARARLSKIETIGASGA